MKILSLFDGISCGRLALERAGLTVSRYVAYEIDAHAIAVSNWNWPDIEQKGSVEGADFTQYRGFDMVIGGSPCQGFSFAGKQLNFDDPRSKLFFEFVRAVKEVKPRYFLLENVVMKKEYQDVITDMLGVKPILINSALVSAQTRKRLYWTNIPGVGQPEDKGVVLADILEQKVNKKFILSDGYIRGLKKWEARNKAKGNGFKMNIADLNGKIGCLTTSPTKSGASYIRFHPAQITGRRLNNEGKREDYNKDIPATQCLEVRRGDKMNCLTTVQKDTVVSYLHPARYVGAYTDYIEGEHFRKLTPVECERLQTLPDGYTEMVSDTQRYNQLGNGWNVDTIAHIFNHTHLDDLL